MSKGINYIFPEIKGIIRTFYFPICIVTILNFVETRDYRFKHRIFVTTVLLYIILLFVPYVFNIGFESYTQDKVGTIGWFFSSNEISSIYGILIAFVIFSYNKVKNKSIYFLIVIFSLYTVLQIGTKVPAVACAVAIMAFITVNIIKYIKNKEKIIKKQILCGIVILLMFIPMLISSPVVKNYTIYKNFLINHRTESANSNFVKIASTEAELTRINLEDTNSNTEKSLTSEELATIIHSGREDKRIAVASVFDNTKIQNKLFGLGQVDIQHNGYYLVEIDYIDIFYNYGYIGFIVFILPLGLLFISIINVFKKHLFIKLISKEEICAGAVGMVNGMFLGALAGHTLVSPSVSIYVAIIIVELFRNTNEICEVGSESKLMQGKRFAVEKKKARKKSKVKTKKILLIIVVLLIMLVTITFGLIYSYLNNKLSKINYMDIGPVEITDGVAVNLDRYRNIVLLGVDGDIEADSFDTNRRTDCIIIVTLDKETSEVKLTSVYRDTYLEIPNYGYNKVNKAYYQGVANTLTTLNRNLDLNITEFVLVNFETVIHAVEAVGKIQLDVDSEEIKYINGYIDHINRITNGNAAHITKTGVQTVNGIQALAYCRIRYTEGWDYKRTERMREVLQKVFDKVKTLNVTETDRLADIMLPSITTNLSKTEILEFIPKVTQFRIDESKGWPYKTDGYVKKGEWFGPPITLESNVIELHRDLFNQQNYVPSDTVKRISQEIINETGYSK
jgi:LCP family protein required for cell wall assembly